MYNQKRKTTHCPRPGCAGRIYTDNRTKQYTSKITKEIICDGCSFEEVYDAAVNKALQKQRNP